ncbi:MAG: phosphatase PAP2 family protein [Actinobacteria bacterium]|nr:phosphatase PAP2 family protein [Actinomycetota bacterium]
MQPERSRWSSTTLLVAMLLTALAAATLTALVIGNGEAPFGVDEHVQQFTSSWTEHTTGLLVALEAIAAATGPIPAAATALVVVVALIIAGRWRLSAFVATSSLVGVALVEVVKVAVARPRPPGASVYVSDLDKSFPSGHAAVGIYMFVGFGVLLILAGRADRARWLQLVGVAVFIFGVTLGLTRIILGVHWTTDVLAGWFYGSTALLLATVWWRPDDVILTQPEQADPV